MEAVTRPTRRSAQLRTLAEMVAWLQRHPVWVDLLASVLLAGALAATTLMALRDEGYDAIAFPCCALAGLAFAVRRVAPVLTVALVIIAIVVYDVAGQSAGPIYSTPFVAAFNLASTRGIRTWLPWTSVAAVAIVTAPWIDGGVTFDLVPVGLLLMVVPKLADDVVRTRRLRMEALEARLDVAEHETMRRVAEERLRIAREVHDVVGHDMATIALRAGVADRVADRDPVEVREALRAIRQVSRDSLGELSALLGILCADDAAARAPAPDLEALPRLIDSLREAGLDVELEIPRALGDGVSEVVGAAGYRIVQEALTNVARHAGAGAHAHVSMTRHNGVIEVEVRDDGRGAPSAVAARGGLTGMRERATSLGGCFEAGGAPEGGFRVWASLPVVPG